MGWHQNVKFLIARYMVDDHPTIVGQRGKCPPICTAPLYTVQGNMVKWSGHYRLLAVLLEYRTDCSIRVL